MKNIVLLLAMLAAILGLASCHTTEANYKAAYDKAVEKTRENMGEDNYAHMQAARMAYTEVVNGDSVRLLRSFCNIVDGKPTDVKKYSIVVAMFDQVITPAATATVCTPRRVSTPISSTLPKTRNIASWPRATTTRARQRPL